MVEEIKIAEGFQQTDIGLLPTEWSAVPLGNVCEKIQDGNYGESYPKAHEFITYGVPFLTSKAIGKDGVLKEHLIDYISTEKHQQLLKAHLKLNDVLFTNRGASVGAIGFVVEKICNGNIGPQLTLLRAEENTISPTFLYQAMKSYLLQNQIVGQDSGSAMNFYGIGQTKKFKVPLPPTRTEQTAIATALSDMDSLIESLEKLIVKKRNIKQGAMQELLTPKDGWVEKELEDIVLSVQLGGNYQNDVMNNSNPLIKMGNLGRGKIVLNKLEYVTIASTPSNKDLLHYGDLLFNTRNTMKLVGKVAIWRNELFKAYFNSNIMRIKFKEKYVKSNFFMNYLFNTRKVINSLADIATGTTSVAAIYTRDLFKLKLFIPKTEVQVEIAQVLLEMDIEISQLETQRSKYKMLRTGMMQELLTGKKRLI